MRFDGNHLNVLKKRQVTVGDPEEDATSTTTSIQTSRSVPVRSSTTTSTPDEELSSTTSSPNVRSSATDTSDDESSTSQTLSRSIRTDDSTSSSATTSLSARTSATLVGGSTSFVTNIVTIGAPSSSASAANDGSSGGGGDGPSAGMVVGVVAGGLVGIVVIAGLLGYFFKTKFGKDKDDDIDDAVFNKNDFRHESIMLQDDDAVSMRSGSAAGSLSMAGMGRNHAGLQRNNTGALSSYDRGPMYNLAPTASPVNQHFAAAPPMPSFQPGQIVNTNYYQPPANNYAASEGGWGVAASYAAPQNSREHLGVQPYQGSGLERQASVASHYEDYQSGVATTGGGAYHDYPPQNGRSGSPVDENPQQFYQGKQGQNTRQLSVRNRGSSGAYDGLGF